MKINDVYIVFLNQNLFEKTKHHHRVLYKDSTAPVEKINDRAGEK